VLACRQVPIVVSALGKASHVLSIDRQDKAEIGPKIRDPGNEQMTCIRRHGPGTWTGLAAGEDQARTGHANDVNN